MNSSAASRRPRVTSRSSNYVCHPNAVSPVPCTAMTSRRRVRPRSCVWWLKLRATSGETTEALPVRQVLLLVLHNQIMRGLEQPLAVGAFGVCIGHPAIRHRLHDLLPLLDFFVGYYIHDAADFLFVGDFHFG